MEKRKKKQLFDTMFGCSSHIQERNTINLCRCFFGLKYFVRFYCMLYTSSLDFWSKCMLLSLLGLKVKRWYENYPSQFVAFCISESVSRFAEAKVRREIAIWWKSCTTITWGAEREKASIFSVCPIQKRFIAECRQNSIQEHRQNWIKCICMFIAFYV